MEEIVIRLNEHNITQIDGIITNGFRWLGWGLIKILGTIVNGMETVVTKIYNLNGFFNSPEVNDLISKYKPLIWVILAISIAMIGMKIIFNKKQDKGQIPSNLIFSVMVIVLLPTLMIKFNDMTSLAVKSTTSGYTSSANELVKNSIYDLHYLDSINYKLDGETNKIPSDKIFRIDENELVDTKKVKNDKVMENKVVVDEKGNLQVEKLEKGWLEIDEEFYRYSMDFISIIVTLGAMAITLLCVALKVARLLFELACDKLFATLFAFADIDDGKKVKEIIRHITTTFVIIFATAMMTKLYVIFTVWLGSSMGNAGLDTKGLAKIVVLVGVSIAVVQGPALIERILGMDAGVKNGWGVTMAGYGIAKGSGNAAKGLASGGIKLGRAGMLGMAGAAGAIAGGVGKNEGDKNSKEEEKEKDKNKENIGKPLSEEMKNIKGTSSGVNNDLENDNKLRNNSEELNEAKQNESENLKNDNKTSNKPTLQEEMNNSGSNNKNSNSEDSLANIGVDKDNNAKHIQDDLAKNESQKANKPIDNTLEEDMKNGELKNNNQNPLQEEMKNNASGDKDSKGNSVRNIQEDLGKNESQKVNKPIDSTLEQQMKNGELKNKNNNQNPLQEEMKNNASGDKNINGNNSKNVQGNIDREKPQNSNNPLQEEMKNNTNGDKNGGTIDKIINPKPPQEEIKNNKTIPNEMNNRSNDINSNSNLKDINNNTLNNNNRNNINSNGMNENNTKNTKDNATGTNDNLNAPNEVKNGGKDTRKNTVGNMEDRNIGQFIADGFKNSKMTNDMSRAYNLGKNTTGKWNVKKGNGDK